MGEIVRTNRFDTRPSRERKAWRRRFARATGLKRPIRSLNPYRDSDDMTAVRRASFKRMTSRRQDPLV